MRVTLRLNWGGVNEKGVQSGLGRREEVGERRDIRRLKPSPYRCQDDTESEVILCGNGGISWKREAEARAVWV